MSDNGFNYQIEQQLGHLIVESLARDSEFRDYLNQIVDIFGSLERKSPGKNFVLNGAFNSWLVHAHDAAKICEATYQQFVIIANVDTYNETTEVYIKLNQLLAETVIMNLYYAYESIQTGRAIGFLGESLVENTKKVFENQFPKLTAARDAIAHAGERAIGKTKKSESYMDEPVFIRVSSKGLAGLVDSEGNEIVSDWSPNQILKLVANLANVFGAAYESR